MSIVGNYNINVLGLFRRLFLGLQLIDKVMDIVKVHLNVIVVSLLEKAFLLMHEATVSVACKFVDILRETSVRSLSTTETSSLVFVISEGWVVINVAETRIGPLSLSGGIKHSRETTGLHAREVRGRCRGTA